MSMHQKKSVTQARANAEMSGMADRPIRWIVDDAAKFTAREVRRERRYDGILLDPPKYGRGPDGEVWHLEQGLGPFGRQLPQAARCGFAVFCSSPSMRCECLHWRWAH